MNRPAIPAWQWAVLLLVFSGAIVFAVLAVVNWPPNQMIFNFNNSSRSFQPANQREKASTLAYASPTASASATPSPSPSRSPTASSTFTPTSTPTPTPTDTPQPSPTPEPPPSSASVTGVRGYAQYYALSCESRAAADLAAFFSLSISEIEFQAALPASDDPDLGYVGSPWGYPGQIPPYSYGVHAAPVAALLRAYGLPAREQLGMSFETLQREIAAGRPVMVWVISGFYSGYPVEYTVPSSGRVTRVAYNEHTVLVTGYSPTTVTVQDGAWSYAVNLNQFLRSWSALGNMAITVER